MGGFLDPRLLGVRISVVSPQRGHQRRGGELRSNNSDENRTRMPKKNLGLISKQKNCYPPPVAASEGGGLLSHFPLPRGWLASAIAPIPLSTSEAAGAAYGGNSAGALTLPISPRLRYNIAFPTFSNTSEPHTHLFDGVRGWETDSRSCVCTCVCVCVHVRVCVSRTKPTRTLFPLVLTAFFFLTCSAFIFKEENECVCVCACVRVWKGEERESAKGDKKIRTHPLSCRLTLFSEMGELLGEGRWRKGLKRRTRRHHLAKVALVKGQMGARTISADVTLFARVFSETLSSNMVELGQPGPPVIFW